MAGYGADVLLPLAGGVFLLGMSKGGFPIGSAALPVFILFWPEEARQAKAAVAFMLPLLCVMDLAALAFYWRRVSWRRVLYLAPGTLAGVAGASVLFVSENDALVAVPDRWLKLAIGVLGMAFVGFRVWRGRIERAAGRFEPGWRSGTAFGLAAGVTSTMAHAAGPVIQMYLLPQELDKMEFAATRAGYFWFVNLVKVVPFALLGRLDAGTLRLDALMLPVIPLGVAVGYALVRRTRQEHYTALVQLVLFFTSALLVLKALRD